MCTIGCLGMTTLDTLLFTDRPPMAEEVSRVADDVISIGGKGMVTALSLFYLGCKPRFLSLIGKRSELESLLPAGFDDSFLQESLDTVQRTWIVITGEQQVYTLVRSCQPPRSEAVLSDNVVASFLQGLDLLYVSAEYLPLVQIVVTAAAKRRIPIVTNLSWAFLADPDTGSAMLLDLLLNVSHTLLVNETEALEMMKRPGFQNWLKVERPNLRHIVITSGAEGGRYSSKPFDRWERYSAGVPERMQCVVGAGDTFNGAYIKARFVDRRSITDACRFAADIAALKIGRRGSALSASEVLP